MDRRCVDVLIRKNKDRLSRNQIKTLRGQLNSGDIEGARKGIETILKKSVKN